MENYISNNVAQLGGKIKEKPMFNHEVYDEKFYKFYIEVKRLSDYEDVIPVIISERIIDIDTLKEGTDVIVKGQFRSYNDGKEGAKSKLLLSVFAKDIIISDEKNSEKINVIDLEGFICKTPVYRETPLKREISDVLIAVNRSYKKSDYIPCIIWGRNAKFCKNLEVGTKVKIQGRMQSRVYEKKAEDGSVERKNAYEISVSKLSVLNKEENI